MARITDWTGISKTPLGYLARVHIRPLPMRAKRFPLTTPLATMQAWRERTRRTLELARPRAATAGTVEADVAKYLQMWGSGKHPQTVEQRTRHLRLFVQAFGDELRATLTTAQIEAWLRTAQQHGFPLSAHAQRRGRTRGALSHATIRKVRQSIFQLFAVLDRGTGLPNPVSEIPAGTDEDADPRGHPPSEVRAVLARLPRGKTRACCQVVAYVGLRPDEVRHIERGDWDARGRSLYVRSAKGGTRQRVPLTRRGAAALRYFARLDAWQAPFTSPYANRLLKDAARALHLDPAGWDVYSLRHSFGSWHYAASRDLKATAGALRQKTLRMAERYVRAAVSSALVQSIDQLDAAMRRRSPARSPRGVQPCTIAPVSARDVATPPAPSRQRNDGELRENRSEKVVRPQ